MPLLRGTKPIEYVVATLLGILMMIGGLLILLVWREHQGFGIALLAGGTIGAIRFGLEAKRRYARRSHFVTLAMDHYIASSGIGEGLPEGCPVTSYEDDGSVRSGVVRGERVFFMD